MAKGLQGLMYTIIEQILCNVYQSCINLLATSISGGGASHGSNDGSTGGGGAGGIIGGVVGGIIAVAVVIIIIIVLYWFCVYKKKGEVNGIINAVYLVETDGGTY